MKDPLHRERGLSKRIPLYWLILLYSFCAFLPAVYAQTGLLPIRNGVIDFSGAGHTSVLKVVATVPGLPGTCSDGEIASVTAAAAGSNLYTCKSNAWTQVKSASTTPGTVTTVGFTGGLISVANPTTTPALTVAGTSGGLPYFSGAATWASSAAGTAGHLVLWGGAGSAPTDGGVPTPAVAHAINLVWNGGSSVLTGDNGFFPGNGPLTGTINRVDISGAGTAGAACSITIDVWKRNAAIPTSANKISASAPATLSSGNLVQSGSLTGWSTAVAANDVWSGTVATVTGCITALVQVWFQ